MAVKAGQRNVHAEAGNGLEQGSKPIETTTIKTISFENAPTAFSARESAKVETETHEAVDAAGNVSKFVKRHVSNNKVDIVEIRLKEEDNSLAIAHADDFDRIVSEMKRGVWVDFKGDGSTNRARLTWISPLKGIYLFTNHQGLVDGAGHKPISISPKALSAQLRSGQAEVISDVAMVDNAMSNVIETLQNPMPIPPIEATLAIRPQA